MLKEQVWQQVVMAAMLAASSKAVWMRAIQQGAQEIERAADWSFEDGVLTFKRTAGGKLYRIDDQHTCEVSARPSKCCKHMAARRLIQLYVERLGVVEAEGRHPDDASGSLCNTEPSRQGVLG